VCDLIRERLGFFPPHSRWHFLEPGRAWRIKQAGQEGKVTFIHSAALLATGQFDGGNLLANGDDDRDECNDGDGHHQPVADHAGAEGA
jgi:hypothetical protein